VPSPARWARRSDEAHKGSKKETAGAVRGMTAPARKSVTPGQGKRRVTGDSHVIMAAGHRRGPVAALVMTCAFYPIYGSAQPLCG